MNPMSLGALTLGLVLAASQTPIQKGKSQSLPSFDYEVAKTHELKPHHGTIPVAGIQDDSDQLHLTLLVSVDGQVVQASAEGDSVGMKLWPDVKSEVMQWTFTPFEVNGKPTTAKIEEYVDLVPPERMPKIHVPAPPLRQNSAVSITLVRTGCFGTCPSYSVRVSTNGIEFDGRGFVTALGRHTAKAGPAAVRELAKTFSADDFYSMDPVYRAGVTDNPTYNLTIDVDGLDKRVEDYVGAWVGMPEVISDLENEVDEFAHTKRWIEGTEGLVDALKDEGFDFKSYDAQLILKEAAMRGHTSTVQEMLGAGVPLKPISPPKPGEDDLVPPLENVGWLNAASSHPETLKVLLDAGASENDQNDFNMALLNASRAGNLASVKELIDAGANPNADFSNQADERSVGGMTLTGRGGAGSVLIGAASSGNPEVVQEVLRYHPDLEAHDREGNTALIVTSEGGADESEESRAECVRLLVEAGANVNAQNDEGNTALHETYITTLEKELLKLGADVNARNNDGETPIFTTVDDDAIALYIQHGADLAIRNNKGQTAVEAASDHGPQHVEAFRKALQPRKRTQNLQAGRLR